jgi:hypothetical protein
VDLLIKHCYPLRLIIFGLKPFIIEEYITPGFPRVAEALVEEQARGNKAESKKRLKTKL